MTAAVAMTMAMVVVMSMMTAMVMVAVRVALAALPTRIRNARSIGGCGCIAGRWIFHYEDGWEAVGFNDVEETHFVGLVKAMRLME